MIQNTSGYDDQANQIIRVFQDSKRRIWTKTPKGLFRIEDGSSLGSKEEFPGIKGSYTVGSWFFEDAKSNLWVSVAGKGIYLLKKDADQFQKQNLGDTLNSAIIYKMIVWRGL